jgi:flagellar hook-basal body complex protein FliE
MHIGGLSQTHVEFLLKKTKKIAQFFYSNSMKTNFAASFAEDLVHFLSLLTQSQKRTQKAEFKGIQGFQVVSEGQK